MTRIYIINSVYLKEKSQLTTYHPLTCINGWFMDVLTAVWKHLRTCSWYYDQCEPITEGRFFRSVFCRFFKTEHRLISITGLLAKKRPKLTFSFFTEKPFGFGFGLLSFGKSKPTDFFGEKAKSDWGHFPFRFTTPATSIYTWYCITQQ